MKNHCNPWNRAEDAKLLGMMESMTDAEIAAHLGRTEKAIWCRRHKLGSLKPRGGKDPVTAEQRQYLRDNERLTNASAALDLGIDSSTVYRIRREMGLPTSIRARWEDWQIRLLREHYPDGGAAEVERLTGMSRRAIWAKASAEGVRRRA